MRGACSVLCEREARGGAQSKGAGKKPGLKNSGPGGGTCKQGTAWATGTFVTKSTHRSRAWKPLGFIFGLLGG